MNIQKALLPGLWSMLAAGGYGSAKVTYPCLLPLLSKLVEQVSVSFRIVKNIFSASCNIMLVSPITKLVNS